MLNIVRAVMESFGCKRIYGAFNGEEGMRIVHEVKPDLIIVDWMMSPMNGIDFARQIRTSESAPDPFVPIILMTGFSQKHRVLEARDAGVNEIMVKPFNARDLYKRIVQVIEKPRQYIASDDFFGPDRRRTSRDDYPGPYRRGDDTIEGVDSFWARDEGAGDE